MPPSQLVSELQVLVELKSSKAVEAVAAHFVAQEHAKVTAFSFGLLRILSKLHRRQHVRMQILRRWLDTIASTTLRSVGVDARMVCFTLRDGSFHSKF